MTYRNRKSIQGMSLIEIMIAMVVFMILAFGITSSVYQSQQISQNNIIRNTAYTIAQGYVEQIKSLPIAEIEAAVKDPSGTPLPTLSISALQSGNIEVKDPIYLDGPDPSLSGQTDGSNYRQIMIDLKEDESTGKTRAITMDAWFDIDITEVGNRSYTYAIEINFDAQLRGLNTRKVSGELRGMRADINQTAD